MRLRRAGKILRMTNHIRNIEISSRLEDPAEPEVWLRVQPEHRTPVTDLQGRLVGPRCLYATTVEVAYPLRPFLRAIPGWEGLTGRVVIPEASFWDLESPFLYQGPLELWEAGRCVERRQLSHGLRSLKLGPRGLYLNQRPLAIRGLARNQCSEEEACRLRQDGFNMFLADVSSATASLWDIADRIGFLVLGRVGASEEALALAATLNTHPSCLGFLLDGLAWERSAPASTALGSARKNAGFLLGAEMPRIVNQPPCEDMQFLVCPEALLSSIPDIPVPKIVLCPAGEKRQEIPTGRNILGSILT